MLLFVFILGLVFGSFINVIVFRIPHKKNILGRSKCLSCKRNIKWFDNIPLVSYLALRAKCRRCGARVSVQYPLLEFSTALIFSILYFLFINCGTPPLSTSVICGFGGAWGFIYLMLLFVVLISIFVIDIKYQIIPDGLVYAGLGLVLVYVLLVNPKDIYSGIFAGFVASSFLLILNLATKGRGMGLGDVKFAIFGGMVAGLDNIFYWLSLSFFIGAVVGVFLIILNKAKLKSKIAFGPFLLLALVIIIIFGQVIKKYLDINLI